MAILKQKLNRKNDSGTYDEIHLKTDADNVSLSETDETTVKTKLDAVDISFQNVNTQMEKFVTILYSIIIAFIEIRVYNQRI